MTNASISSTSGVATTRKFGRNNLSEGIHCSTATACNVDVITVISGCNVDAITLIGGCKDVITNSWMERDVITVINANNVDVIVISECNSMLSLDVT